MASPTTLSLLVYSGLALLPAAAAAQAPAVDALLRAGVEHRLARRDAEAFASFSAAWMHCRCAEARAQMALAAQALGRWCDALELLDEALSNDADPYIRRFREPLTRERSALAGHVGEVRIEVDAPSALVSLDGATIAPAPAGHCAAVGPHTLSVSAPGRVTLSRALIVEAGGRLDLGLALPPRPAAATPPVPSPWPGRARAARWVTLGSAILALATAAAATGFEADAVTRWNDDARCLADGLSRAENCGDILASADQAHAVAIAGYLTAGTLAVGTTILWAFATRRPVTRERSHAVCLPDVRGMRITCSAAF